MSRLGLAFAALVAYHFVVLCVLMFRMEFTWVQTVTFVTQWYFFLIATGIGILAIAVRCAEAAGYTREQVVAEVVDVV